MKFSFRRRQMRHNRYVESRIHELHQLIVREVIEEAKIEPSILEKVEQVKSNSLLAREE